MGLKNIVSGENPMVAVKDRSREILQATEAEKRDKGKNLIANDDWIWYKVCLQEAKTKNITKFAIQPVLGKCWLNMG